MRHHARNLRKSSTQTEHHLWRHIRSRRLSQFKFKRQQIIGPYIVDFVCQWKKLIIELDGGQHSEAVLYDTKRTAYLERKGYQVIRFWNNDVLTRLDDVLEEILRVLSSPSPRPSPAATRCDTVI